MTKPLVSIIMPAFNAQKYITESILSVVSQTYSEWELIVIDDGSTDGTAAIVKSFAEKDSRISYLFQNRGRQGKARNLGIKNSNGEYIAFLDADDTWLPKKLTIQTEILKDRPDIDLVFTCGYNLLPDGSYYNMDIVVKEWSWKSDADQLIGANQIPILSVLVRRKAVEHAGLFSEKAEIQNVEDYHLWLKLLKTEKFISIADRLCYYRLHENQSTYQGNNTALQIANCFYDLVDAGFLSNKNTTLRSRMKWLIFQNPNLSWYLERLKKIFSEKERILSTLVLMDKMMPGNKLLKKIAFHLL